MELYNLEIAMTNLLEANTELMNKVTGIYNYVPESTDYPYIVIGEDKAKEFNTKTFIGKEINSVIYVFHEARSALTTKEIVGLIEQTLTTEFTEGGFYFEHFQTLRVDTERDNVLSQATLEIIFRSEEA